MEAVEEGAMIITDFQSWGAGQMRMVWGKSSYLGSCDSSLAATHMGSKPAGRGV